MRRTPLILLLLAPLLVEPAPAAAQPWADDSTRAAGRQALEALRQNRFLEADSLSLAADPVVRKLVVWGRVQNRNGGASAAEIVRWLDANPDWPLPITMSIRAEDALVGDADDALALRQFGRTPARTLPGVQRHADALIRTGRATEAAAVLRAGWRDADGDGFAEQDFLGRNAAQLTADDHWSRADRLFWANQAAAAARLLPMLDAARRATLEARLAARAGTFAGTAQDIGVAHELARTARRADRDAEAAAIWHAAEPLQRDLSPEAQRAIWVERQVLSRKTLRLGDPATAYRLAANHGQSELGEPRQEGEFLAGFIALRMLNQPAQALAHFTRLGEGSSSVITRARSAYWEGAALATLGRTAQAQAQWREAATLPVAFYGQLASLALGETPAQLAARIGGSGAAAPGQDQAAGFLGREMVRAVVALADLGQSDRARMFLLRLEELSPDAGDRWLIARLGVAIRRPDHAVWIARRAGADGVILLEDGWPTPYPTPNEGAEPALVNAITRQESNFDLSAVSSANARGPMQLLPSTAAGVARRLGVPHSTAMLTTDAAHNLRLGSAFIGQMLERFGGAMPLAAAGYNAGPGRVDQWLGTYGDPRSPSGPHVLDWIEQIPFGETRNYVQRVIENVVIYRARNPATGDLPHPLAGLMAGRR
ncbi:lytic transglycosylase domain-containing protein [Roseomonas frigidaquae]|uniref:Lytic transglycosylase domain-containing protein n=1 Tax=Falsiroseomonas frigidaquae TaxID=487318 RepID=A0ABX1F4J9_9PROT|nr:lytic transglycosylase domain-containing protein [Falsiroseomonas frigidaquae]